MKCNYCGEEVKSLHSSVPGWAIRQGLSGKYIVFPTIVYDSFEEADEEADRLNKVRR